MIGRIKAISFRALTLLLLCPLLFSKSLDRAFNHDKLKEYAESRDFAYMNMRPETNSIWDDLLAWLAYQWHLFWSDPVRSDFTWIIICLAILAFGVFLAVKLNYRAVVTKNTISDEVPFNSPVDDSIDYDVLIGKALGTSDFKLALRYLYLQSLQKLSKGGLLSFQDWKTPYDYERELPKSAQSTYQRFALLFEYGWYGDFEVKRSDFDKATNFAQILEEEIQ